MGQLDALNPQQTERPIMTDLIERTINRLNPSGGQIVVSEPTMRLALEDTLRQASDALLRMREALEPFAKFAEGMGRVPDHHAMTAGSPLARKQVTAGDFKRARSVLSSLEGEGFSVAPSRGSASEAPHSASQSKADIIEARARLIYDGWCDQPGWVPWVPGGNSIKQDDARRLARSEIEEAFDDAAKARDEAGFLGTPADCIRYLDAEVRALRAQGDATRPVEDGDEG